MQLVMTKDGEMTRADMASRNFSSHYEHMRKYHTNVKRLIKHKLHKNNKSGSTGVFQSAPTTYLAYITFKGRRIHLGSFPTYQEAVDARKRAEEEYYAPVIQSYSEEYGLI